MTDGCLVQFQHHGADDELKYTCTVLVITCHLISSCTWSFYKFLCLSFGATCGNGLWQSRGKRWSRNTTMLLNVLWRSATACGQNGLAMAAGSGAKSRSSKMTMPSSSGWNVGCLSFRLWESRRIHEIKPGGIVSSLFTDSGTMTSQILRARFVALAGKCWQAGKLFVNWWGDVRGSFRFGEARDLHIITRYYKPIHETTYKY